MTFEEWWNLFLEGYNHPKRPVQEVPSTIIARAAWDAGYWEGTKHPPRRLAMQEHYKERS